MIARYTTAIASGSAITTALFYLMNTLIVMQPSAVTEDTPGHPAIWIHQPRAEDPPIVESPLVARPEILHPPVTKPRRLDTADSTIYVARSSPPTPASQTAEKLRTTVDGPLVAMIRVRPVYPPAAAQRNLDGFVTVQFDVMPNGSVANVRVVDSSHRIFEANAVRAASRFRYKPHIVAGVAQTTPGVRYLFTFRMDDET